MCKLQTKELLNYIIWSIITFDIFPPVEDKPIS